MKRKPLQLRPIWSLPSLSGTTSRFNPFCNNNDTDDPNNRNLASTSVNSLWHVSNWLGGNQINLMLK